MKQYATNNLYVILALFAALSLSVACASDNDKTTSTGGTSSAGGATALVGTSTNGGATGTASGATGQGGTLAAGGATGGTGTDTSVSGRDCTSDKTQPAPNDGLIANFSSNDGGLAASPYVWSSGTAPVPTTTTTGEALHVSVNAAASSDEQYLGVIIGPEVNCIDASAFTGVQFTLSGSFSGCKMQYATGDVAHQDESSGAPFATGPAGGSNQPIRNISATQVTSTPTTFNVPFVGGTSGGSPSPPLDKTKLIFVLWQFVVPADTTGIAAPCVADITVDDVKFY